MIEHQPALPDMELIDVIEQMSYIDRLAEKDRLLAVMSDAEKIVHLINEVNGVENGEEAEIEDCAVRYMPRGSSH